VKINSILKLATLIMAVCVLDACGSDDQDNAKTSDHSAETGASSPEKAAPVATNKAQTKLTPSKDIDPGDPAIAELPKARIETSMGDITVVLYKDQAPLSVENFKNYIASRHYVRTVFHRIIPGFMIQGGGFSNFYEQRRTKAPVPYEGDNGLKNDRGTLAMARTRDPNSATAQWYINLEDNEFLNHGARNPDAPGYTVFGRVISGMNIVDAISNVETGETITPSGQTLPNAPIDPVLIQKVVFLE